MLPPMSSAPMRAPTHASFERQPFRSSARSQSSPWRLKIFTATFLAQGVNGCGCDDPFDAARQFRVKGYERVCLQLRECNVFGVVGRGPSQLIRQVPGPAPEHGVAEEPDLHPPDAGEAVARDVGWELTPLDGLVQSRQRLGTKERRCEELVRA